MSNYITTDWLNLRKEPVIPQIKKSNVIGILPPETVVEELSGQTSNNWLHVKTFLVSKPAEGYVSTSFLKPTDRTLLKSEISAQSVIPPVHLPIKNGKVIRRSETNTRAYHLNEPGMKQFHFGETPNAAAIIGHIHEVIDWIDVEHSARYAPNSVSTYCNIYAYDVVFCCGLYIPRVWWNETAFLILNQQRTPDVIYGETVTELNANALTDWFEKYGQIFGWQRVLDIDTLQEEVNKGTLGIIVAQRINLNRSGHIVAVVPETNGQKAQRDSANKLISPLQSQAGVVNKKYFSGNNWWANPNKFRKFGFWVMK
jgi:hypothetical protein